MIRKNYKKHHKKGLAHVYRKCKDEGYSRCFESMCKQIKKHIKVKKEEKKKVKYPKTKITPLKGTYPGEIVEIDVKFVPIECIGFKSNYDRYYQITAIDLYSRKRVLKIVNEHSTYETTKFLMKLEEKMGFKIKLVQTDNGREFCNYREEKNHYLKKC